MKTRFAPSPTGKIHLGNVRAALLNYLLARKEQGTFLLRMDDTDTERSTLEFEEGILKDLRWLGLEWDEYDRQSARLERYDLATEALKESGRLYPCYETSEELSLMRKSLLSRSLPPIYDRSALKMTQEEEQRYIQEGRKPHWRFKLNDEDIDWVDLIRGPQHFQGSNLSDPVLIREDGRPLYTLSSVVDDIELEVTHIIRGEDHVANTAVQVQLFKALKPEGTLPEFGHFALLTDKDGKGLSKRLGSLSIENLREAGLEAMTVNAYMAKIGSSDAVEAQIDLAPLIQTCDLEKLGRSKPKLDEADLERLNAQVLSLLPYEAVKERLPEGFSEEIWSVLRANLNKFEDINIWHPILFGEIDQKVEDKDFAQQALDLLPEGEITSSFWKLWTTAVKETTGRKGKMLFLPLREMATGLTSGPEMGDLLPLLGKEKLKERLHLAAR